MVTRNSISKFANLEWKSFCSTLIQSENDYVVKRVCSVLLIYFKKLYFKTYSSLSHNQPFNVVSIGKQKIGPSNYLLHTRTIPKAFGSLQESFRNLCTCILRLFVDLDSVCCNMIEKQGRQMQLQRLQEEEGAFFYRTQAIPGGLGWLEHREGSGRPKWQKYCFCELQRFARWTEIRWNRSD